uniref:Uncharacterized protein n=1 Tax=Panstrongylus lignarius TaxID=156445 RepID=A0A224Y2W1_9HEMI
MVANLSLVFIYCIMCLRNTFLLLCLFSIASIASGFLEFIRSLMSFSFRFLSPAIILQYIKYLLHSSTKSSLSLTAFFFGFFVIGAIFLIGNILSS